MLHVVEILKGQLTNRRLCVRLILLAVHKVVPSLIPQKRILTLCH